MKTKTEGDILIMNPLVNRGGGYTCTARDIMDYHFGDTYDEKAVNKNNETEVDAGWTTDANNTGERQDVINYKLSQQTGQLAKVVYANHMANTMTLDPVTRYRPVAPADQIMKISFSTKLQGLDPWLYTFAFKLYRGSGTTNLICEGHIEIKSKNGIANPQTVDDYDFTMESDTTGQTISVIRRVEEDGTNRFDVSGMTDTSSTLASSETYRAYITFGGVGKWVTATYNAYYPWYYLVTTKSTITVDDIISNGKLLATRGGMRRPNQTKLTVNMPDQGYLWIIGYTDYGAGYAWRTPNDPATAQHDMKNPQAIELTLSSAADGTKLKYTAMRQQDPQGSNKAAEYIIF